jgi:purine-cytosine permease-like protein
MALLWITMVTVFPGVLIGFEWFKQGYSLRQVIISTVFSGLLLLAYSIPAGLLGAHTGLSYTMLSRLVFGSGGAKIVALNLVLIFIAFYGLAALFLAEGLAGLIALKLPLMWLSAICAVLMAANNFFGFKGVANFARFVAAPLLIVWVGYTFFKTLGNCPVSIWQVGEKCSLEASLTGISGFVIGFAVWGNECDYWRFGKSKISTCAWPLIISLLIGQFIFPITGYMVAYSTGITEYGAATAFMNDYSFGGFTALAVLVLTVSYFAVNDSNLFGSVQACIQLKKLSLRAWVAILAGLGTITAAVLSISGAAKSLEAIVSLNCVILPTATVVMLCEWWLSRRMGKGVFASNSNLDDHMKKVSAKVYHPAALTALICGIAVGVLTSGVLPWLKFGIPSLQAWLAAAFVYMPLRFLELRSYTLKQSGAELTEQDLISENLASEKTALELSLREP